MEKYAEELEGYKSDAELHNIFVPLSTKEMEMKRHLLKYFLSCYTAFAHMSDKLKDNQEPPCGFFWKVVNNPTDEQVGVLMMLEGTPNVYQGEKY